MSDDPIDGDALAKAQAALAAQEALLRTILDTVPVGIVMGELPSGRIIAGNAFVEQMLRHPVLPSPDIDSYDEWVSFHADGTRVSGHEYPFARMMLHGDEKPEIEVQYQRGDGTRLWVRIMGRPVRNATGDLVGAVAAVLDIDAERRASEALLQANADLERRVAERTWQLAATSELFAAAFDSAPIGMALVGLDGRFHQVNAAFAQIVGYPPGELLDLDFQGITHPQDLNEDLALREQLIRGEITTFRIEKRYLRKDGTEVWVDLYSAKVLNPDGSIRHFIKQVQDLTVQKQAHAAMRRAIAEAEEANRAKSDFLAVMSHEIRTPLNGILGMAQALSAQIENDHQRQQLEVIRQSGESLLAIVNDVLDLSKIEAGKLELNVEDFSVADVTRDAYAAFTALADNKGLAYSLQIAAEAEGLYIGDPTRIRQVLCNLISNALKFTDKGKVSVALAPSDEGVEFCVRDTGIGIPRTHLESMFDRFEQGDRSTTRRFGGTGLGLSISRDLAQLMGGSITVDSEEGQGSSFLLRIPLEPVQGGSVSPTRLRRLEPQVLPRLGTIRVLAAEDNPTNQMVLKTILDQLGVDSLIVADGHKAVDAWESGDWDLILMDVQMPVLDGVSAVSEIRHREQVTGRRRTPIAALSANAMPAQVAEYLACGMDGFVAKPINIPQLCQVISELLSKDAAHSSSELSMATGSRN